MKNVLALIRTDLRSLFANTVATIVTIGLIIVPPMYAWLTTLGFWNPYGNTDGLSVAVANEDAGYSSALFPSRVDVGATDGCVVFAGFHAFLCFIRRSHERDVSR